jgi:hypothetical protein
MLRTPEKCVKPRTISPFASSHFDCNARFLAADIIVDYVRTRVSFSELAKSGG